MNSKVSSRPNHYEALGLDPGASADEIADAYARILRLPNTVGQIALAGIAYEVLRDTARRAAYDESIGLRKPPQPALLQWSAQSPFAAPYLRTARAQPVAEQRPISAGPPAPETPPSTQAEERNPDDRLPSFLATALRDIAKPEPLAVAEPRPPFAARRRAIEEQRQPQVSGPNSHDIEDASVDWRRIGIGAGALVAVAGLFGVWAGSEAGNDAQSPQPQTAAKAMLPPATPFPTGIGEDAPSAAPVSRAARVSQAVAAAPPKPEIRNRRPAASPADQASDASELPPSQIAASDPLAPAAEQPPQELVKAAVNAASMPLPNRTIARTIERIGYSCGQVASTDAVEGQAGVFTVSCTSGHAYQARPVNGRYRFKRLSR